MRPLQRLLYVRALIGRINNACVRAWECVHARLCCQSSQTPSLPLVHTTLQRDADGLYLSFHLIFESTFFYISLELYIYTLFYIFDLASQCRLYPFCITFSVLTQSKARWVCEHRYMLALHVCLWVKVVSIQSDRQCFMGNQVISWASPDPPNDVWASLINLASSSPSNSALPVAVLQLRAELPSTVNTLQFTDMKWAKIQLLTDGSRREASSWLLEVL